MDRELTRNLTQVVLWIGIFMLSCLGGGAGGLVGGVVTKVWLKSEKPTFGGENFSLSISKRWLFWFFAGIGAITALLFFYLLFHTAVSTELPGYL